MGSVVHCKRDAFDVYIGRPSEWGNPFTHKQGTRAQFVVPTREEAVAAYRSWLFKRVNDGEISLEQLAALDGKTLGCWCAPLACHGDVLTSAAAWAARQLNDREEVGAVTGR